MRQGLVLVFAACAPDHEPADDDGTTDTDTPSTTPETETVRDARFDGVAEVLQDELGDQIYATGLSIAVLEQGELTWVEGFGTADPDGDKPITPDMAFQIGSTTKQMTASLVLREVEGGVLALDDTVAELLPNVSFDADPTWADAATLELLMSHQGGIFDYIDLPGPSDDDELRSWHEGFFSDELWANNPPGAFWNYANPNLTVAGLAAEAHDPAGRFYPDMLVEDLFQPLGMTRTFARKADVTRPYAGSTGIDAVTGAVGTMSMDDLVDPGSGRPAGFVWSTPTDMTTWGSFVLHGDPSVLSDDLRGRLTTPEVSTLYLDDHVLYGFGEFLWDRYLGADANVYPLRIWEHGGNTPSMTSTFYMLPDQDVVISILSNGYGDAFPATLDALLHVLVTPFPAPVNDLEPVDPATFAVHAGSYLDPYNVGPIEITEGGLFGLQISMPDLDDAGYDVSPDLIPVTNDFWYVQLDGGFAEITFVRDPAGGPTPWVRDRFFVGARVTDDGVARAAPILRHGPPVLPIVPPPTALPLPKAD